MPPPELTLSSRIVVSRNQVSADVSGEAVVLGMHNGIYYGLDTVATRIWQLVQQPQRLADVAAAIASEFDVESERAGADLIEFVSDLAAHGLVEVVAD